jgi:SsrA-binding protein
MAGIGPRGFLAWILRQPAAGAGIGDNGRDMSKIKNGKDSKGAVASSDAKGGKARAPVGKTIALNKAARHEYHLEDRFEAGLALQGWELKAIRAGRLGIGESYALLKGGEAYLFGAQITPLISASTHVIADDRRTRKLLLHRREIDRLVGYVERDGYTLIPTAMYWRGNKVKLELALAKGKKTHDKRATEKERDWQREKQRTMRSHNRNA